jgi:steroid delta-isomerase
MARHHEAYRRYLETLSPSSLENLAAFVTPDVRFKDPFNDVRGVAAMQRVLTHMFDAVGPVFFRVTEMVSDKDSCMMHWRFSGTLRDSPWVFDGMTVVRFDGNGRVCEHIDYWDAAGAFYERLPAIGALLRWLRTRLAVR